LPGLPMLGHGQIEGFRERYGMEFRRARWDEPVDEPHVGHFERTIAPLLRRRAEFAGTARFRLYDAIDRDGSLVEDVFAFTNGYRDRRSLVLVHNRFGEVDVRIDRSVQFRSGDRLQSTRLGEDLELPADGGLRVQFADPRSGWRVEASVDELRRDGLHLRLGPYEARVLDVSIVAAEPDAVAAAAREPRMGAPSTAQSAANGAAGRPARRTRRPTKSVTSATDRPAQSPKSRRRRSGNGRSP